MTAPAAYGRAFALWRASAGGEWGAYVRHPFVEALADGTLPRRAFLGYLAQDYLFLVHFSRAWALAAVKGETIEEIRFAAGVLDALIGQEMRLHVETCAAAGIPESALMATPEAPENLAYTRYVLDAGLSGDLLDLLAALAPCVLGYGEIGSRLAAEASLGGPYANWIATYGGADYQAACAAVGGLIDLAVRRRLGDDPAASPRWPRLAVRFATAVRLEAGFWDMGFAAA